MKNNVSIFKFLGPGFIVAATGIGAGDMIAASVAGAEFGTTILWAALLGGIIKFVINENIARWQLATDTTVLSGWIRRLPKAVSVYFMIYLVLWAFVVGGTLSSFCGLAAHTVFPLAVPESVSVLIWGAIHAVLGAMLVWFGKYRFLEQVMKVFITCLFGVVIVSAGLTQPDWGLILSGLFMLQIPASSEGVLLILGVIGGVGGSVTLLSYAYWLKEKGWSGPTYLKNTRIDLAAAYFMTALFGVAIMIIAAQVDPEEVKGYAMILSIANSLGESSGWIGKWMFMIGFWGAVASSLIGVWSGVPYLFDEFIQQFQNQLDQVTYATNSFYYRLFLLFLTFPPLVLVAYGRPVWIGIAYAVIGAFFMPFLAGVLLYMNNKVEWVGKLKNGWVTNVILVATLIFFVGLVVLKEFA